MVSLIQNVPEHFGECVKEVSHDFLVYWGQNPWEQQIQNSKFHENLERAGSLEPMGDAIHRAIFLGQFDYLSARLERRMGEETVRIDDPHGPLSMEDRRKKLCQPEPKLAPEMEISSDQARVHELVTADVRFPPGNLPQDCVYAINFSADEAQTFNTIPTNLSFQYRGTKRVNAVVTVFRRREGKEESAPAVRTFFLSRQISVTDR